VRLCNSVRTNGSHCRTDALADGRNYTDLSARRHITGSPVGKVSNRLRLCFNYIINVTHLVWVFTCRSKILLNKLAVTPTLLNTTTNPKH